MLFLLIGTTGCSDGRPSRVPVAGKILIDGEPLTYGSIQFKPTVGGRTAGATINAQGEYSVTMYEKDDGLPLGSYMVGISSDKSVSDTAVRWLAPKKFAKPESSEIVVEIEKKVDSLDFELSWEDSDSKHKKPWVERY